MSDHISLRKEYFRADLICIDVLNHPIRFEVAKLYGKSFKDVTFRYVILDAVLELFRGKRAAAHSLVLVVCKGCRKDIAELVVPLSGKVVIVLPDGANLVLQDILK